MSIPDPITLPIQSRKIETYGNFVGRQDKDTDSVATGGVINNFQKPTKLPPRDEGSPEGPKIVLKEASEQNPLAKLERMFSEATRKPLQKAA